METIALNIVDKIEILSLQDNYIDLTAADNSAVISRATPLKEGELRVRCSRNTAFQHWSKLLVKGKLTRYCLILDFPKTAQPKMPKRSMLT